MVYHHVFTLLPFILLRFISFGHKPSPMRGFCGGLAIKSRERLSKSRSFPLRETQFVLLNFVLISFVLFHSISLMIILYAEIKPTTILFELKSECVQSNYLKRTLNLSDSDLSSFLHFKRYFSSNRGFKYFRCRLSVYTTRSTNIIIDGFLSVKADKLQNYFRVIKYIFALLVENLIRQRQSKFSCQKTNCIIDSVFSAKAVELKNYKLVNYVYVYTWVNNLVNLFRQLQPSIDYIFPQIEVGTTARLLLQQLQGNYIGMYTNNLLKAFDYDVIFVANRNLTTRRSDLAKKVTIGLESKRKLIDRHDFLSEVYLKRAKIKRVKFK